MALKSISTREATRSVVVNALIAALYVTLTLLNEPLSFGQFQFRIAEMLVLICFFKPDAIFGVTLGCFIANIYSPLPLDLLFGTMATLISSLLMLIAPRLAIAALFPIVVNAFVVGAELYFVFGSPFWVNVGWVGLGELAVIAAGYVLFIILMRNKKFMHIIGATRRLDVKW